MRRYVVVLALAALAISCSSEKEPAIVLQDNDGRDYRPEISAANFVTTIDNRYLAFRPGASFVYEGEDDGEKSRIEIEVTTMSKTVMGVPVTVVKDVAYENGKAVEETYDWYAQDRDGNVWYFGEDTKELKDGRVLNSKGSWEAGVNGALPGIIMKANPKVGDAYRLEFYDGEAEDAAEVLAVGVAVQTKQGSFKDCVQTKDWNPLEPDVIEHKFYCAEVGNLVLERKVTGGKGEVGLTSLRTPQ